MKRKTAFFLLTVWLLQMFTSLSSFGDVELTYCVTWWFGTPGEYYAEYYKEGETPRIPDIIPTKSDDTYLYEFVRWKETPKPVVKDTVYHPLYKTYLKKYAMNTDNKVDEEDAKALLSYLQDEKNVLPRSGDVDDSGQVDIRDVTALLLYIGSI